MISSADLVHLLGDWGYGRSLARQIKPMVATDYGWVGLAYTDQPTIRHLIHDVSVVAALMQTELVANTELKLPRAADTWAEPLRPGWQVFPPKQTLMTGPLVTCTRPLPQGYSVRTQVHEQWAAADVHYDGESVAHVQSGLSGDRVVFDNVHTNAAHQRRGLATSLMAELSTWAKTRGASSGVLVASEEGRMLYERLGYTGVSPMMDIDYLPGKTNSGSDSPTAD